MSGQSSAGRLLPFSGNRQNIIAVVGCGGKTTFVDALARELQQKKVLVSPTTKILPMTGEGILLRQTPGDCEAHVAVNGIQCLGVLHAETGKLHALPPDVLKRLVRRYDAVLLEADGSRGLPCKSWLPNEPVVPEFCTHTVGIVTLDAVGKPAAADHVLRLPAFLQLTGLQEGETITARAMTNMVCMPQGMFQHSRGKKLLLVNRAETPTSMRLAEAWLREIKAHFPGKFDTLAFGSARQNRWREV